MSASLPKRIFNNINWILIEKVSKAVLTALTSILVARYLGASGLAAISMALTVYSIFAVFGTLGLERILLKELEAKECKPSKLIGGALLLRLLGALLAFVSMNVAIPLIYPDDIQLHTMVMVLSFAFFLAVGNIFEVFYRRQLRSRYVTIARVMGLFASAISKLFIISLGLEAIWFTFPVIIETIIVSGCFLYLRYHDESLELDKLEYSSQESLRVLKMAWPLLMNGLVGTLYFQLDKVFIYQYMDSDSLGRYALLFQLVSILLFLIHSINLSVLPILNRLYFEAKDIFWGRFREVTAFKFLLALLFASGLSLTGNFFIPLLVGDDFTYSLEVLLIFSSYFIFVSIGSLQAEYCVLIGVIKPLFYLRIVTLALNILLNIWLIPVWGLAGAAIASVGCYFLNQFLLPLMIKEIRPVVWESFLSLGELGQRKFYKGVYAKLKQAL